MALGMNLCTDIWKKNVDQSLSVKMYNIDYSEIILLHIYQELKFSF